jgi:hypothetical protein
MSPVVISVRHNVVASIYAAVVILTWVFQSFRLALSKGPNRVGVSPHLRTETDPVSETPYFLFFRIQDDGRSPKTQ